MGCSGSSSTFLRTGPVCKGPPARHVPIFSCLTQDSPGHLEERPWVLPASGCRVATRVFHARETPHSARRGARAAEPHRLSSAPVPAAASPAPSPCHPPRTTRDGRENTRQHHRAAAAAAADRGGGGQRLLTAHPPRQRRGATNRWC